jgi:hypothetical protein
LVGRDAREPAGRRIPEGGEARMGEITIAPEPVRPRMNFAERLLGVFISPGETFADIARAPDFIAPLIVGILCSVVVSETMLAKFGMDRIIRMQLEQSGRATSMSPEQLDQAVHQGAAIGAVLTHVVGLIMSPIYLLIIAGLGILILDGIFGATANFKTIFSTTCYAYLLSLVPTVMALAMILFGDPDHFNAQNPAPTNVGFFLNPLETSKALQSLASSVDLYVIWFLIVLAIGLHEASARKVKTGSIFWSYVGAWAVWILGKTLLVMITS